jgi:KaiC/GvpD/RAD55 family RecA-like ATPase
MDATPEDFFNQHGTYERFEPGARGGQTGGDRPRFAPLPWPDMEAIPPADYLVKGILDRGALGVIFGPSGCGKTFLTLDLALAVALGRPWFDRRVRPAPVVYVASEAGMSLGRRLAAYRRHHGIAPSDDLRVIADAPDMLESRDVAALVPAIGRPGLVIVDTLSRSWTGDENSTQDMGRFVAALDRIRAETSAAVLVVHHTGKNMEAGARGSNALKGAADTEIAAKRDDDGTVRAKLIKARDGETGTELTADLESVEVGRDADGDPITSCVVVPCEAGARVARDPLTPADRHALDLLSDELTRHGQSAPPSDYIPHGVRVVALETWRQRFYAVRPDEPAPTRQKAFQRARQRLLQAHRIGIHDPHVWIAKNDD